MNILVQGSGTRIKLTKSEVKTLADSARLIESLAKFDPSLQPAIELVNGVQGRVSGEGIYTPKDGD